MNVQAQIFLDSIIARAETPSFKSKLTADELSAIVTFLATKLDQIKPGSSLFIRKTPPALPRTLSVIRREDGSYMVRVHTKSKLAGGIKQQNPISKGSEKRGGKTGLEIEVDKDRIYYESLVQRPDYRRILNEIKISQMLSKRSNAFVQLDLDVDHTGAKNKTSRVTIASDPALGDLARLGPTLLLSLPDNEKYRMMYELFEGLNIMHTEFGLVHNDIKPQNILVYQDEAGKYHLKFTDFGFTCEKGRIFEQYTLGYEPPELGLWILKKEPGYYRSMQFNYYGKDFVYQQPRYGMPPSAITDPSRDMWSMGIIMHVLFNQRSMPYAGSPFFQTPIGAGLLNLDPKARWSAANACQYLKPLLQEEPEHMPVAESEQSSTLAGSESEQTNSKSADTSRKDPISPIFEEEWSRSKDVRLSVKLGIQKGKHQDIKDKLETVFRKPHSI